MVAYRTVIEIIFGTVNWKCDEGCWSHDITTDIMSLDLECESE